VTLGTLVPSNDFTFRVDPAGNGVNGSGKINREGAPLAQQEGQIVELDSPYPG
jgi:hypothetical protein